jgi:predicted RND superfamily exporter protein
MNFKLTNHQITTIILTIQLSSIIGIIVGIVLLYLNYNQIGLILLIISMIIATVITFGTLIAYYWGGD